MKIWKWLQFLYSVPFIKKTLVNQDYIQIWSSGLTFTVLQWMKKNFKISQFSSSLLSSGYRIWSSWLTFTVLQWMKTNFKISWFSRFLLRSEQAIHVKIWKWLKLLNSFPFIKERPCKSSLISNLIFLNDFHSFTVNEEKFQN